MKPLQSTIFQIGDCLTIAEKFKEEFDENYILSKCRENKCSLKDINQRDYLILDGDGLKETDEEKSVDCI